MVVITVGMIGRTIFGEENSLPKQRLSLYPLDKCYIFHIACGLCARYGSYVSHVTFPSGTPLLGLLRRSWVVQAEHLLRA